MRHFMRVDADGRLIGVTIRVGGFDEDHALTDPSCAHPLALDQWKAANTVPNFDRFVEYVCSCDSSVEICPCPHTCLVDNYAEGSVLTAKPALTVLVDDVPLPELIATGPLLRTTGTTISLKLQGSAPDGHQVTLKPAGTAAIIPAEVVLTFNGGETDTVSLTAPATGMSGKVFSISKYVRQFLVQLKGS